MNFALISIVTQLNCKNYINFKQGVGINCLLNGQNPFINLLNDTENRYTLVCKVDTQKALNILCRFKVQTYTLSLSRYYTYQLISNKNESIMERYNRRRSEILHCIKKNVGNKIYKFKSLNKETISIVLKPYENHFAFAYKVKQKCLKSGENITFLKTNRKKMIIKIKPSKPRVEVINKQINLLNIIPLECSKSLSKLSRNKIFFTFPTPRSCSLCLYELRKAFPSSVKLPPRLKCTVVKEEIKPFIP